MIYDWMYVEQLRGNMDSIFGVARRMAKEGGHESQQFFLTSLAARGVNRANMQSFQGGNTKQQKKPLDALFPRWLESAHNDIANGRNAAATTSRRGSNVVDPLSPASSLLMNWMGHLGPAEENAKILSLLDDSLDISAEVARRRRAERKQRRRSAATAIRYSTYFQLKYGKEDIQVQIQYPRPNEYVDQVSLMLLREVYEVFKRNDVLDDLPEYLAEEPEEVTKFFENYLVGRQAYYSRYAVRSALLIVGRS
ncbi:MAG: hypothetical protein QGG71_18140 [Pirellulaceae bacterium]|jgi:23S rRNA maturation mini-RNase III|nr:hypothetical protein [Planctomycetaceae bacterium]MDP6556597.1 hypothetical protein [Pirellulaceae bacterium]